MDQKISSLDELTDVAGATDELVIVDKSDTTMGATGTDKRVTPNVLLEDTVHGATSKTTPVDADLVGLIDSEDSNVLKSLTWDNAKETLKTYFDSLATTLTNKTLTNPKIGTAITDTNGLEIIKTPATASAVNEITVTNAATTDDPKISATGGDTNIHLSLDAKGDALVKLKVLRQNNTTDSYKNNTVILAGWGWNIGNGTGETTEKTVTLGITFSELPIIITGSIGFKDGSDPSDISELLKAAVFNIGIGDITTSTFKIGSRNVTDAATIASNRRVGFSWIAIGQLN